MVAIPLSRVTVSLFGLILWPAEMAVDGRLETFLVESVTHKTYNEQTNYITLVLLLFTKEKPDNDGLMTAAWFWRVAYSLLFL